MKCLSRLEARFWNRLTAITSLLIAGSGAASATPQVENLLSVPAPQIERSLGFNANPAHIWELQAVKAAGGAEVRSQLAWSNISTMKEVFDIGAINEAGLDECYKLRLQLLLVASYSTPFKGILTVHLAQAVPVRSNALSVKESIVSLAHISCQILEPDRKRTTSRWSYAGTLIDSMNADTRTRNLASATTIPPSAGTTLRVDQSEYLGRATSSPADPSVVAYGRYAEYLANCIGENTANRPNGLTGRVGLWSEPQWPHDAWDSRVRCYDTGHLPAGVTASSPISVLPRI